MEPSTIEEQINSKYLIKELLNSGFQAFAFLVLEKETNKEYVAKVFKESQKFYCDQEVNILNTLKEENNPYIVKIIDSGEGEVIRKNKPTINTKYYILEYASFGNIFDYIYYGGNGFGELYGKVIFSKIMEGIKVCHEHDICHRDLKLENILLDKDFCPKVCDFGFACINSPNLTQVLGTKGYLPPEMYETRPYDGKNVDIFCLGEALMILVTGIPGFEIATKNNQYYQKICRKNISLYWKIIEPQIKSNGIILSPEFKDLYIKMVTYNPGSRPSAETVLNHPWFDEIKELKKDKEKMVKIENELKQKLIDLEPTVREKVKKHLEAKNSNSEEDYNSSNTRSAGDEGVIYFNNDIKAKEIDTQMNMNNCIKIKKLLNPNKFMNSLCQKMINKFGNDNCFIKANKKRLKLEVIFEEDEEVKDELPEEIKEELKKLGIDGGIEDNGDNNDLKMNIKLYKYSDEYILRFIQREGKRNKFLDKFTAISNLVENIIN